MRLASLRIKHFRAFDDQTITFTPYTCLVGPNGAGKSTVLTALNVLFRESASSAVDLQALSREDFHRQDTSSPIEITATFTDLSEAAQEDLKAYVRHNRLIVSAVAEWKADSESAPVTQHGERLVITDFAPFFRSEKEGAKAAELKEIFQALTDQRPEIRRATSKADMIASLREYEEAHEDDCELERSVDQFYGWSKGANLLQRHIQWVFVPAVKDASTEADENRTSALGKLLARTVRARVNFDEALSEIKEDAIQAYRGILADQKHVLDDISASLDHRLRQWAHPGAGINVVWNDDPAKSVSVADPVATIRAKEGDFEGQLARFGHGLQRSYLLALLQELADEPADSQPTLLLGMEEPELFQHPPQARHLATVLADLSTGEASQVIACTHSPLFVPGDCLGNVRLVRRSGNNNAATAFGCDLDALGESIAAARGRDRDALSATAAKVHQALNTTIRELFFAPAVVLVEGIEDHALITSWLELTGRWPALRRAGVHLIPAGGKGFMIEPLAILRQLGTPTYVIFDSDGNETNANKRQKHETDNQALLRLCDCGEEPPFPQTVFATASLTVWPNEISASVRESFGDDVWQAACNAVRGRHDLSHAGGLNKNPLFLGLVLAELFEGGHRCGELDELCDRIVAWSEG